MADDDLLGVRLLYDVPEAVSVRFLPPPRVTLWKMGPWGSCDVCGGPTRAVVGCTHRHMVCASYCGLRNG